MAAAVAGVASAKLASDGVREGALIMPAVFALIAATMVLHGFSLAPLARRLGLTLGDRPGLAILGATPWSVDLAQTLMAAGTPVLVIDTYPGALDAARALRIPVLQAEILSEHGEDELAGRRIDYLLAATPNDVYNSLVCAKLAPELGRARVFQMQPSGDDIDTWSSLGREWRGQVLGLPPLDFASARMQFRAGSRFALREVTEADVTVIKDPAEDVVRSEAVGVALLILRRNGDLVFVSAEALEVIPAVGDKTLLLVNPERAARTGAEPALTG